MQHIVGRKDAFLNETQTFELVPYLLWRTAKSWRTTPL